MVKIRLAFGLLATMAALLLGTPISAGTVNGTMGVSATVEEACHLDVHPLRFDTLRSDAVRANADSSLGVACTPQTSFTVTLDDGLNRGDGGRRRMANAEGTGFVAYELYSDAARTRRWGASSVQAVSGQITGASAVTLPIYGRIDDARAPAGAYSDIVTITVSF